MSRNYWNKASNAFMLQSRFIGLDEQTAITLAVSNELDYRIGSRDGVDVPLTAEHCHYRVNFVLVNGFVTKVVIG